MQQYQASSPTYAWQVVASPSTIVTFTHCHAFCVLDAETAHTVRVSCRHLHLSKNKVWTRKKHKRQKTSTPVENNEKRGYCICVWSTTWSAHVWKDFQSQADFFCFTCLPILLHPLSTTSCHYFSWIHARVHKSPICHDIWWTRQGLQESGPVWGCDLVSSLSASGSTGTERRKGWRKGERENVRHQWKGRSWGLRRLEGVGFMLQFGPGDKLAVLRLEG